jgi:hypothetical protein
MTIQNQSGTIGTIAEGMYVYPAGPDESDPFASEILGIAKTLSIQLASQLHPHLGSSVRAGWVLAGAYSLLTRAKQEPLTWLEVALEGGTLTMESYAAASSVLPESLQLDVTWSEGTSCLIEAAKHLGDDGDAHQFVVGQTLNQSPSIGHMRTLLSLALAAQHPNSQVNNVSAKPIDVSVKPSSQTASRLGKPLNRGGQVAWSGKDV